MNRVELEKLAFLCMCNSKDRKLVLEKEEMGFYDFDRLIYLMEYMEFNQLSVELWNKHSDKFNDKFKALENIAKEEDVSGVCSDCEYEMNEYKEWIENFLKSIRSKDICEWIINRLEEHKRNKFL